MAVNIVKHIPTSKKDMEHIEELAKNKLASLSKELMPVAKHLTCGVVSNVGIIKLMGGTEYIPAIGASIISSIASGLIEKQYHIKHPLPKVIVGSACYTGAAMLTGERIPLTEAVIMGIGTNILSEIVCKYL